MSNTHHSLSLKVIGLVLAQNGMLAALLFYTVKDTTPLETLAIIGALIVSGLVTITVAGSTLGALKTLSRHLPGIAEEHLRRTDEIGAIARELERLSRENLTRLVEDDEERDRRNRQEAERQQQHALALDAATGQTADLTRVLNSLDSAMRRFATGDLNSRLDTPFPDEFEGLRADFNHAIASLQETLDRIGNSSRQQHSIGADMKEDSASVLQIGARQAAVVAKTLAELGSLAETLRARKMQTEHTANIAYNARVDMRRPKDDVQAAAQAMISAQETALKIEPVAAAIREIAFEANMLAMNVGIDSASREKQRAGSAAGTLAANIRSLAERAAETAKEISLLSRQSTDAAERSCKAIGKAESELDAMAIYVNAIKGHLDTLAASSSTEIEKIAAIRLSMLALAGSGREQSIALETLTTRTDRMMREAGAIDHQASRFTPVTVLTQGGVTVPASMKPPKRGHHLRLVK